MMCDIEPKVRADRFSWSENSKGVSTVSTSEAQCCYSPPRAAQIASSDTIYIPNAIIVGPGI
jgi:hypothetical protein